MNLRAHREEACEHPRVLLCQGASAYNEYIDHRRARYLCFCRWRDRVRGNPPREERESMKLSLVILVLAAAAAISSCSKLNIAPAASPGGVGPKQIWSGTSAGFTITWSTSDIVATPQQDPKRQAFSELTRTALDFHKIARMQTADCDMTRQAKIQSIVGTIISIQRKDTMKCTDGASGASSGSMAVDLAHPKSPLLLSSLFPAHELDALRTKAQHFCKTVPDELQNRFAFSELHGKSVVVAVTLGADCSQSEVDLVLNVPPSLKKPLELASKRQQGFLWHDEPAIAGSSVATINYHYRM